MKPQLVKFCPELGRYYEAELRVDYRRPYLVYGSKFYLPGSLVPASAPRVISFRADTMLSVDREGFYPPNGNFWFGLFRTLCERVTEETGRNSGTHFSLDDIKTGWQQHFVFADGQISAIFQPYRLREEAGHQVKLL